MIFNKLLLLLECLSNLDWCFDNNFLISRNFICGQKPFVRNSKIFFTCKIINIPLQLQLWKWISNIWICLTLLISDQLENLIDALEAKIDKQNDVISSLTISVLQLTAKVNTNEETINDNKETISDNEETINDKIVRYFYEFLHFA